MQEYLRFIGHEIGLAVDGHIHLKQLVFVNNSYSSESSAANVLATTTHDKSILELLHVIMLANLSEAYVDRLSING